MGQKQLEIHEIVVIVIGLVAIIIAGIVGSIAISDSDYNKGVESQKILVENYRYELDKIRGENKDKQLLNENSIEGNNKNQVNNVNLLSTDDAVSDSVTIEKSKELSTTSIQKNKTTYVSNDKLSISLIDVYSNVTMDGIESVVKISISKENRNREVFKGLSVGSVVDYENFKIQIVEIGYSVVLVSVMQNS
mgnify:CR=1 FL=1